MVTYEIQGPDGKTYSIDGPEGASKEEIVSAIQAKLAKPKEEKPIEAPSDEGNFMRGLSSYLPQLKETYGATKVLAGKAFGSEDLMKSGIESMNAVKSVLAAKHRETDSFTEALDKGIGTVLTDWLPYQVGSGAGNILESLAVMGAGALAGSAIPGLGTLAGGATGLVEKELLKRGVKKAAEKIIAESGEAAAKEFVERETISAAKGVAKHIAGTAALAVQAGFHGAGETTSRAMEEAERLGKEATDIELGRVIPSAIVHSVAEFFGDKIGLGAFNKINTEAKSGLLNFAKTLLTETAITGAKEAPVEVIQTAAERFGAKLSLADAEAVKDYVNSAAAAFGMAIGPAAGGAVRTTAHAMGKEDTRLAEEMVKQRAADVEAKKAAAEAAKVDKTAVPDAQGNVALPTYTPLGAQPKIGAATEPTVTPEADATATIPGQAAPATTAAPAAEAVKNVIGAAYAEHGTTRKVQKAVEEQLTTLGVPKEEQKTIIESVRAELGVPDGGTPVGRKAKKEWQENYKKGVTNAEQPTTAVVAGNQPSTTSVTPAVGAAPAAIETSDVTGVEPAGRVTKPATGTEVVQPATLNEYVPPVITEGDSNVTQTSETIKTEKKGQGQAVAPSSTTTTEAERRAALKATERVFTKEQVPFITSNAEHRASTPRTIDEATHYAAAETAFDLFDSAEKATEAQLGAMAKEKGVTVDDVTANMSEEELMALYTSNAKIESLKPERQKQIAKRDAFIKTLSAKEQEKIKKKSIEFFRQEVKTKRAGKEATEADKRKARQKLYDQAKAKREKRQADRLKRVTEPSEKTTKTTKTTEPTEKKETLAEKLRRLVTKALSNNNFEEVMHHIGDVKINDSITAHFALKLDKLLNTFGIEPNIVIGKVEGGHAGKFDPATDTITIDLDNLGDGRVDILVLHELTHYLADHAVDNRHLLTSQQKIALAQLEKLYAHVEKRLGKQFEIGSLKEFMAQAFSNPEFQIAMTRLPSIDMAGEKRGPLSVFAKRIMQLLGFKNTPLTKQEREEGVEHYGVVLGDVLSHIETLISLPAIAKAKGVSYMAGKQKNPPIKAPAAGADTFDKMLNEMPSHEVKRKEMVKKLLTAKGGETLTRKFQNDRAPIKRWQNKLMQTGRLISYGLGLNNIYDQLTLSSGNAHWLYTQYIQSSTEAVRQGIIDYAKKHDIDVDRAVKELGMYSIALHESERRDALYIRSVPLTDQKILTGAKGVLTSPNEARDAIFAYMDAHELDDSGAKYLRAQLESIVNDPKNLSEKDEHKAILNKSNEHYNVAGFTQAQVQLALKEYQKNKADADPILNKLKDINKAVIELNEMSNYMSKYAMNYVKVYDFQHYVPFKGKFRGNEKSDLLNFDNRKLGGELQDAVHTFEGRLTVPDNPILQVMADGAQAAMRAGRRHVTEAIFNSAKKSKLNPKGTGVLDAEVVEIIDFKDRADESILDKHKGDTKVFHYMPDGKIAIIQIRNHDEREAIRRTYKETNRFIDVMNSITGLIGQGHTRYNVAFAPANFVRDVLTNAFTLGAELGPTKTFQYLGAIAADVAQGKMYKTWNFSRLYANGKTGAIEQLAKTDTYYKDLMDYVKTGGRVSYIAGIAPKGQYNELFKGMGGNRIASTKAQIDKVFDLWIDTFEMTARVSAFRIAKSSEMAEQVAKGVSKADAEKAAIVKASAYAKNLANFEQVGEWGKTMGAFFMFFRPSATGAVRAIEAVAPAWMNMEKAKLGLSEFARIAEIKELLAVPKIAAPTKAKLEAELAEMQGYVKNFEKNFAEKKKNALIVSGALVGAGAVAYLMSKMMADDDDLGRNKVSTDDMSRWTKFARFHIPGTDTIVQIPWGFGLGGFAAAGAQVASMFDSNTRLMDSLDNLRAIAMDSFLPLPMSRIPATEKPLEFAIDSLLPSIARPLVEYVMNVDALGRQIYNNRQSRFGDAYTGGDNIPEAYKDAARWLVKTTNGSIDVSPNSLYFFANNYADGASRLMHNGYNMAMWLGGTKDFNAKTDLMVADSFIGSKSNFDARTWQRIDNDMKDRAKKISMFEDSPEQLALYLSKHPLDAMLVDMHGKDINGTMKTLSAQKHVWQRMEGLPPNVRSALIKNVTLQENLEKYRLVQLYSAMGVKP